jgi:hypothetical protein
MLSTHLSQRSDHHKTTHNDNHLIHYPEHSQQHQQSDIQALNEDYALHPEKSVAVFVS